ncbi:endonuclease III [Bdellovibrio reynosensis]|uniref:Endonuclease III n=1 Tax=Bdellovibrio reynosensis TaxID=2835041 RepID=A0ABY4C8R7_9BACT|nr:endonuclease III [Bdellovibrio reynosensis]UOE99877.1 endonuclease III [Bdellovibrio reynosensis]
MKPLVTMVTSKKKAVKKKAAKKVLKPSTKKVGLKKPPFKEAAPILETIDLLRRYYPDAHCALNFTNPYELLVATALSAQTTDERVNMVTPALFNQYGSPQRMAKAKVEDIESLIRSTNFYKNKAKNLKSAAIDLVEKHNSEVPQNIESLVELAGVGRKTANVVLGNAFGIPSGIVVDTHVARLSYRLGWVDTDKPVVIEEELCKEVPQEDWVILSHYLISHGRAICKARKPDCAHCFLEETCPKRGV